MLPRVRQLKDVPTRKTVGVLIPRNVGQVSPAQTRPARRGGTDGDTGEGTSSLGCDVGSAVLVTTRDPGCRDKAGNVLESFPVGPCGWGGRTGAVGGPRSQEVLAVGR